MSSSAAIGRNYLNQRLAGSFSGLSGFMNNRKNWTDKKAVQQELRKIEAFSLHKNYKKRFPRRRVFVKFLNQTWTTDLADIQNIKRFNSFYTFILIVVDVFSRKAYVRPLKSKHAQQVIAAFKSIFKESKVTPMFLWADRGIS